MKKNDILVILIPSLLIIVLWVIFNIYHNFVTSTIPTTLNIVIQPISAEFDDKALSNIKDREDVSPTYELSGQSIVETAPAVPLSSTTSAQSSPGGSLSQ